MLHVEPFIMLLRG